MAKMTKEDYDAMIKEHYSGKEEYVAMTEEDYDGAFNLSQLKYDKTFVRPQDFKAMKMRGNDDETQGVHAASRSSNKLTPKPEFGYSIDGTKLPRLPPIEKLQGIIGKCSDPFEKRLNRSDFDEDQDRLSLPIDVKNSLLTLLNENEIGDLGTTGIQVNIFDHLGNSYQMILETYLNSTFKLYNGWEEFLKDHKLKEYQEDYYLAVWMFRHQETDELCFALTLKRYSNNTATDSRKK